MFHVPLEVTPRAEIGPQDATRKRNVLTARSQTNDNARTTGAPAIVLGRPFQSKPSIDFGSVRLPSTEEASTQSIQVVNGGNKVLHVHLGVAPPLATETPHVRLVPGAQHTIRITWTLDTQAKQGTEHKKFKIKYGKKRLEYVHVQCTRHVTLAQVKPASKRVRTRVVRTIKHETTTAPVVQPIAATPPKPESKRSVEWNAKRRQPLLALKMAAKQHQPPRRFVATAQPAADLLARGITTTLNHILSHQPALLSSQSAFFRQRARDNLIHHMHTLYHAAPMRQVLQRVNEAIEQGRINVRQNQNLLGNREVAAFLTDQIALFAAVWLHPAVQVIGAAHHDGPAPLDPVQDTLDSQSEAQRFVKYLLNPVHAATVTYDKEQTTRVHKRVLRDLFHLLLLLDTAKRARIIPTDPCLFAVQKEAMATTTVLTAIGNRILTQGDIVRHLSHIDYKLMHEQQAIDSYDFFISRLGVDLRDGVRLTRLAELLTRTQTPSLGKLRVPANTRERKLYNVAIALKIFEKEGLFESKTTMVRATRTTPADIVNGNQLKTLALLWNVILRYDVTSMLQPARLCTEVDRIQAHCPGARRDFEQRYLAADNLQMLLRWVQTVCWAQEAAIGRRFPSVVNFSESFRDGRTLCLLVNYYHPTLLCHEQIHLFDEQEEKELKIQSPTMLLRSPGATKGTGWVGSFSMSPPREDPKGRNARARANFMLLNESLTALGDVPIIFNGLDMAHGALPDEKVVIMFVTYLCNALLSHSREIHACRRIQRVWRGILARRSAAALRERVAREEREATEQERVMRQRAVVVVQCAVRCFLARRQRQKLVIQRMQARAKHQMRVMAATTIQCGVRGFLVRRRIRPLLMQKRHQEGEAMRTAVVAMQALRRGTQARRRVVQLRAIRMEEEAMHVRAAIRIQSVIRAHFARAMVCSLRDDRRAQEMQLRVEATIYIQALVRGYLARKSVTTLRDTVATRVCASICIQAQVRGYLARKWVASLRDAVAMLRITAVTRMQSYARGHLVRRHLAEARAAAQREAALVLQCAVRCWISRRVLAARLAARRVNATVTIQCAVRCFFAKQEYQSRLLDARAMQDAAAVEIQRVCRGFVARRRARALALETHERIAAVVCIQRVWRRALLARARSRAATRIQCRVRVVLAMRAVARRRVLIVSLQSRIRGKRVRRALAASALGPPLATICARLARATQALRANPELSIGVQTARALQTLLTCRQLCVVDKACTTLEKTTRALPPMCLCAVRESAVPVLYGLIQSCNRSKPHMVMVVHCLRILTNIARYRRTRAAVFEPDCAVECLSELLQVFRDKENIFGLAAALLQLGCEQEPTFADRVCHTRDVVKRMTGIMRILRHKLRVEKKFPSASAAGRAKAQGYAREVDALEKILVLFA